MKEDPLSLPPCGAAWSGPWGGHQLHGEPTEGGEELTEGVEEPAASTPMEAIGGVLPDELSLERLVGVGQVVHPLQDVLELGHCQLLQGQECEIELQFRIYHVEPVKRGLS